MLGNLEHWAMPSSGQPHSYSSPEDTSKGPLYTFPCTDKPKPWQVENHIHTQTVYMYTANPVLSDTMWDTKNI